MPATVATADTTCPATMPAGNGVADGVGVLLAVGVALGVGVALLVGVLVGVAVVVGVLLAVGELTGVSEGVAVGLNAGVLTMVGVSVGVTKAVGVLVGGCLVGMVAGVAVPLPPGEGDGVGLPLRGGKDEMTRGRYACRPIVCEIASATAVSPSGLVPATPAESLRA